MSISILGIEVFKEKAYVYEIQDYQNFIVAVKQKSIKQAGVWFLVLLKSASKHGNGVLKFATIIVKAKLITKHQYRPQRCSEKESNIHYQNLPLNISSYNVKLFNAPLQVHYQEF